MENVEKFLTFTSREHWEEDLLAVGIRLRISAAERINFSNPHPYGLRSARKKRMNWLKKNGVGSFGIVTDPELIRINRDIIQNQVGSRVNIIRTLSELGGLLPKNSSVTVNMGDDFLLIVWKKFGGGGGTAKIKWYREWVEPPARLQPREKVKREKKFSAEYLAAIRDQGNDDNDN